MESHQYSQCIEEQCLPGLRSCASYLSLSVANRRQKRTQGLRSIPEKCLPGEGSESGRWGGQGRREGHPKSKGRSLAAMADHSDAPAMGAENCLGNGQAHARPMQKAVPAAAVEL